MILKKSDVTFIADIVENFIQTHDKGDRNNPILVEYSSGYACDADLEHTKIESENIQETILSLIFANAIKFCAKKIYSFCDRYENTCY